MVLITRKEAQVILKINSPSTFLIKTLRAGIIPKSQEIRNKRACNLYEKSEIEALASKLNNKT